MKIQRIIIFLLFYLSLALYCESKYELEVESSTVYTIILKSSSENTTIVYLVKTKLSGTDSDYKTSFIQNIDFFTFRTPFEFQRASNVSSSYDSIILNLKDRSKTKLLHKATYSDLHFLDFHDADSLLNTSFNEFILKELKPNFSIGLFEEDQATIGKKYISLFFNDNLSSNQIAIKPNKSDVEAENNDFFYLGDRVFKKINLHFHLEETEYRNKYKLSFTEMVPDNYFEQRFDFFDCWKDTPEEKNVVVQFIDEMVELGTEIEDEYNLPESKGLVVLNDFVHKLLVDGHFMESDCESHLIDEHKACEFKNKEEFGLKEKQWIISFGGFNEDEEETDNSIIEWDDSNPKQDYTKERRRGLFITICVVIFGALIMVTVVIELRVRNRSKKKYNRNFGRKKR